MSTDGDVPRLVRQRGVERGELLVASDGGPPAAAAAAGAPGRGWKTRPVSNSATSAKPRPTLRRSVASRPGSSVVRSIGCSSEIGLTRRSVVAAGVVGGQAERVEVGVADERVAEHLDVAGVGERAADPRGAAAARSVRPRPAGAPGSSDGIRS